ncbi:hypothetical protein L484_012756 [Morus notabilis]|uniref:Uncharacterized protein n=1 Tax=Morus notabilis TaxID=981085 RepID=W9RVT7_9ROSA|nr:hypothetical protein L484_012756 [Morus notabilis]
MWAIVVLPKWRRWLWAAIECVEAEAAMWWLDMVAKVSRARRLANVTRQSERADTVDIGTPYGPGFGNLGTCQGKGVAGAGIQRRKRLQTVAVDWRKLAIH